MKISVRNLGVISEANIDLNPLTVFVGPNNAGKTWLAYAISSIFGSYGCWEYTQAYIEGKIPSVFLPLDTIVTQIYNEGSATMDLDDFANNYGEIYFNNVASLAHQWMHRYMKTDRVPFADLEIIIDLAGRNKGFLEQILQTPIRTRMSVGQRKGNALLGWQKNGGESNLFIYTSTEEEIAEKLPQEVLRERLITTIFRTFHRALFPSVRLFPTERTTFIASSLVKRTQELDTLGEQIRQEQNSRAFIAPVRRFINMMYSIFEADFFIRDQRDEKAKQSPVIQSYIELAQILEQDIMGGSVDFSTPEPGPGREILFKPGEDFSLEIPIASSMVKELVPLALYLRYLAEPGELLIIDEPEMNLHPEAQVKLTEFLAMMVNAGLRVLVTTHSTYVVDHLINLMDASKHEKKDEIVDLFFLQRPEAFIPQDDVSVYLIERGTAQNILDENGIIHWDTFSNVTDRVERIHFQL